jgi:D-alanine-D-alanine ligase
LTTLHGGHGENGAWQGLLELADVPYVSAGVKGSALAMDKVISKRVFEQLGVPTPRWCVYRKGDAQPDLPPGVGELVAKPPQEGSSVGIEMMPNNEDGWAQIAQLARRCDTLLIEERIHGRELTVGVIGPNTQAVALPIVEIIASADFYDYEAKYGGTSRYECPAQIDMEFAGQIAECALRIYRECEMEPYARVDCILNEHNQPYFLEANTLPGFTEHSLLPMAARAAGIEMGELLELLMLCAVERHEARHGGAL